MKLSVISMGHSHPSIEIDNKFLEDLDVGTNAQWIMEKIGIEKRLSTLPLDYIKATRNADPRQALEVATMTPSDLAKQAALMALERAKLQTKDIGLIIVNTCTPNQSFPTEAQRVAQALNLECPFYDVMSACPAFSLHIDFINAFEADKLPEYVLCISTAAMTQRVNYNDRTDGAIWGDGAAAWIVSTQHAGKLEVEFSSFMADPLRCDAVVVDSFGYFHQDGRAVRDFSVRQTVRLIKQIQNQFEIDWQRDVFIGHQANATMLSQITNNRQIPEINHWSNVGWCGNQAGAGAPCVLSANWDRIKPGQNIVVAVLGAGLSWGSVLFKSR